MPIALSKSIIWLFLVLGLAMPLLTSITAIRVDRLLQTHPAFTRYSGKGFKHSSDRIVDYGIMRFGISSRRWPAILVLAGSIILLIGLAVLLHDPLISAAPVED